MHLCFRWVLTHYLVPLFSDLQSQVQATSHLQKLRALSMQNCCLVLHVFFKKAGSVVFHLLGNTEQEANASLKQAQVSQCSCSDISDDGQELHREITAHSHFSLSIKASPVGSRVNWLNKHLKIATSALQLKEFITSETRMILSEGQVPAEFLLTHPHAMTVISPYGKWLSSDSHNLMAFQRSN